MDETDLLNKLIANVKAQIISPKPGDYIILTIPKKTLATIGPELWMEYLKIIRSQFDENQIVVIPEGYQFSTMGGKHKELLESFINDARENFTNSSQSDSSS